MAAKTAVQQAKEVVANAVPGPQVRHIIRGISNYTNPAENVYTASEVEMYIAAMEGWKLHSVHHLENKKSPSSAATIFEFAYILIAE